MKLYKYRPINEYVEPILTSNKIWFPKRKTLNDPEDLLIEIENDITVETYREFLINKSLEAQRPKKFLRANFKQAFDRNGLTHAAKRKINLALKKMQANFDRLGILSLSENADDEILWDEYAEKKKGVCLEFELPHSEYLLKVLYVETRPKLKLSELLFDNDSEKMLIEVLRTKTMKWSHENEWRYFIKQGNVEFSFMGSITGIRFGIMTELKNKQKIITLIDSCESKIKIYG
ncbi:MAG: DUF2971 domain-containing protein [Deltaproteobacteria bacterium]|nr:MAG: DUF2971 domain-containing protein [Deltaproteobacteria bacterium]